VTVGSGVADGFGCCVAVGTDVVVALGTGVSVITGSCVDDGSGVTLAVTVDVIVGTGDGVPVDVSPISGSAVSIRSAVVVGFGIFGSSVGSGRVVGVFSIMFAIASAIDSSFRTSVSVASGDSIAMGVGSTSETVGACSPLPTMGK
jgi:hypothetical protein